MANIPLSSLVYAALCELSDASSNLEDILSLLDHDSAKDLVSDILKDVDTAYNKLKSLSL